MKEQVNTGLLAVIALTLIVNTYFNATNGGGSSSSGYVPNTSASTANTPNNLGNATQVTTPAGGANAETATPITPSFDPASVAAETKPAAPATSVKFNEYDYNFGNIKQNSENIHLFSFTNTGDKPLIIENAKGSCGCTVPKYPKEPIAPGATGEIEVVYKPGTQKNQQTKSVTITANTEPVNTILKINAFVEEEG